MQMNPFLDVDVGSAGGARDRARGPYLSDPLINHTIKYERCLPTN
jgi:hypothetical protein